VVVVIDGREERDLQILVLRLRVGVASTSMRAIWKLCPLLELINTGDCAPELFVAFGAAAAFPLREELHQLHDGKYRRRCAKWSNPRRRGCPELELPQMRRRGPRT
jgi:hypothetical protein